MLIKEVIENCLKIDDEEKLDNYINSILRKLFGISKLDYNSEDCKCDITINTSDIKTISR